MVLPAGTTLPPLPYLVGVLLALAAVGGALVRADPDVTDRLVVALAPWMATGAALYVGYELGLYPDWLAPLLGSPTVYLSTATVAGAVWLAALHLDIPAAVTLAATGSLAAVVPVGLAVASALARGAFSPVVPLLGAVAALAVAAGVWYGLLRATPEVAATGAAGALAVFAHTLDGVTTALGVGVLGFGERTPLSAFLLDLPPLALPVVGTAWLFVLVKVALGAVVAWLLAPTVRSAPREGYLLLAVVAAVGLGPGVHNVVLFATADAAGAAAALLPPGAPGF